jgi:tetratricopeptide (TPR) repeat protein
MWPWAHAVEQAAVWAAEAQDREAQDREAQNREVPGQEVPGQVPEPVWDVVQFRPTPADSLRSLQGEVVDLTARVLELKLPSGSNRRISRAEIVGVKLLKHERLAEAERQAVAGDFAAARQTYEEVLRGDAPHWMKRFAAARRIQMLRVLGQYPAAVPLFVALAEDDPAQVPYEALPVVWSGLTVDALLEQRVKQWLTSGNDWERLAGASLGLLHAPTAGDSRQVLEALAARSRGTDPRDPLAAVAEAQLWRGPRSWTPEQVDSLQATLEQFPPEIKAGPWLVLGKLRKNVGQSERAADAFLQIAAVYPEQHDLVLLGLESAYFTLKELDPDDALRVGRWLVQQYPESPQAAAIKKQVGL